MSMFSTETVVNNTPLPVDGSGVVQPVSGTVTANAGTGTFSTDGLTDTQLRATPVPVSTSPVSTGAASVTRVAVSTTVTTLKAANASRIRLIIHNETGTLFVKFGSAATDTDYTYRLTANFTLEIENYTGIVTGIKATGGSFAQVTEI